MATSIIKNTTVSGVTLPASILLWPSSSSATSSVTISNDANAMSLIFVLAYDGGTPKGYFAFCNAIYDADGVVSVVKDDFNGKVAVLSEYEAEGRKNVVTVTNNTSTVVKVDILAMR